MICYADKTFCASPNCTNECGRKLTDEQKEDIKRRGLDVCYAFCCGWPESLDVEVENKGGTDFDGAGETFKG